MRLLAQRGETCVCWSWKRKHVEAITELLAESEGQPSRRDMFCDVVESCRFQRIYFCMWVMI